MTLTLEKIKVAASQLSKSEQVELAHYLWEAVGPPEPEFSPEFWAEIERRSEEIDSGKEVGIPLEVVQMEMKSIIDEARKLSSAREK